MPVVLQARAWCLDLTGGAPEPAPWLPGAGARRPAARVQVTIDCNRPSCEPARRIWLRSWPPKASTVVASIALLNRHQENVE